MNFLEGTRFTPQKHDQQNSPFRHLLKPKSGGVAYAISVLADEIDTMVDVTIYYPDIRQESLSFWDFMSGKCKDIYVHVRTLKIPGELKIGDYENDPVFRQNFQRWVQQLWNDKDALLSEWATNNAS